MNTNNHNKGFSLIETIVAVTILAAAIAGPMTLAAASLRASRDARLELIATHFAEEGVEVIHNIRDNNVTNYPVGSWLTNILPVCAGSGCVVDVTQTDPLLVWSPSAVIGCIPDCSLVDPIYYNPNTGLYRQSAAPLTLPWTKTTFTRSIKVVGVDDVTTPLRQARMVVTVNYQGFGGKTKTVVVDDDLYNWFPPLR